MAGVAMLMENSGIMPPLLRDSPQPPKRRSRIIKDSLLITLVAWQIVLLSSFLWNIGGLAEGVVKLVSLVFFILGLAGLARFAYGFLFVHDPVELEAQTREHGTIRENPTRGALPFPHSVPVSDYSPRSNTREIVSPPSVTENTTRLLVDPDN